MPENKFDKAAAKIEGVNVGRWPGRIKPMMTAHIGNRHKVLARFESDNDMELFLALVRRGMVPDA